MKSLVCLLPGSRVFGIEIARGALGHGEPLLERVGLPQGAHRERTGVSPFKERPPSI
jgi:hypothetical protein